MFKIFLISSGHALFSLRAIASCLAVKPEVHTSAPHLTLHSLYTSFAMCFLHAHTVQNVRHWPCVHNDLSQDVAPSATSWRCPRCGTADDDSSAAGRWPPGGGAGASCGPAAAAVGRRGVLLHAGGIPASAE